MCVHAFCLFIVCTCLCNCNCTQYYTCACVWTQLTIIGDTNISTEFFYCKGTLHSQGSYNGHSFLGDFERLMIGMLSIYHLRHDWGVSDYAMNLFWRH